MSLKKVFLLISLIVFFIAGNSLAAYDVTYRGYFSKSQWSEWAFDGQTVSTTVQRNLLEAIQIELNASYAPVGIEYRVYNVSYNWTAWIANGQTAGTVGQKEQIAAIEIRLIDPVPGYSIKYRVYDTRDGWLPWVYDGQTAGYASNNGHVGAFEIILLPSIVCSTPSYEPGYWNDNSIIQKNNNCYNYSNNRRTDTFAQPGRAGGDMYTALNCIEVTNGAIADGLEPTTASAPIPAGKTKIAMVNWPDTDYHWYRLDSDGMWTHKPGQTQATNLDSSGNVITNPETADRGSYTIFCGYFLTCSDVNQGEGHANIR